jgi:HJR/Mrr/RecB family endonuclease
MHTLETIAHVGGIFAFVAGIYIVWQVIKDKSRKLLDPRPTLRMK